MWRDSESDQDFLNFTELADQIAALATNPRLLPISIGVFGTWGTGKSTVLELAEQRLRQSKPEPIIIEFDAWLYQGFDDSKAALMEVVAERLLAEAKSNDTLFDKAKSFARRINYFRAIGMAADFGIGMAFGVPPGLLTKAGGAIGSLITGDGGAAEVDALKGAGKEVASAWSQLVGPKKERTPPKEIAAFRKEFEEIIAGLDRPLVLFIDNLDRCLPDVAIGTLEAIRLFLFIKGSAFVIAADEDMVRHSVSKHFGGITSRHVNDYLDKVIQVPLRVPQVSAEDVRAYMYSLFVGVHAPEKVLEVQKYLLDALQNSWAGKSFDKDRVNELSSKPKELLDALAVCDRLAPILATAPTINGNPRIIKRLLNAITLRQSLAIERGMNISLATLAKLAVFERSTDAKASERLYRLVMEEEPSATTANLTSDDKVKGKRPELPTEWKIHEEFVNKWRNMEPHLEDAKDLRPALFLSRDVLAPSYARSGLSDAAKEAVDALLAVNSVTSQAASKTAKSLSASDRRLVMEELIAHLRKEDWKKSPRGVHGAIVLAKESPEAAQDFKAFLGTLSTATMHKATKYLLEQDKLLGGG